MNSSIKPDTNHVSFYNEHCWDISNDYLPDNPQDFDSILKLSHSSHLCGAVNVSQGKENAVDINVCHGITLSGCFGSASARGDQAITIKGGSSDIEMEGVVFTSGSGAVDVDIGNHSDQSYALNRDIRLDLRRSDGLPVRVRVGWARPFSVKLSKECHYLFWQSLGLKAYVLTKLIVRAVLRIPQGVKGPAWL